jgi:cell division ATPase FtsA
MIGTLLDLAIIALLVGAVGFGLVIDRRVKRLTAALRELEPAVQHFSSAVDRSVASVTTLKTETRATQAQPPLRRAAAPARSTAGLDMTGGTARIEGKADLVRSFFDTMRSREA